jgi:hypothetical protein
VTGPRDGDPAEEPIQGKDEGLPADDLQVRESGLVAGGSVHLAGYNVAGRDLTISVTGHNAAGRDLTVHQHFTSDSDTEAFIDEQLPALPPPVREPIRRLRVRHRALAAQLAGVLVAPDGSGLLTLGASSVQTAPEGSCRIVWMIKRMIKPGDAAPSVTQTTAGIVERSPDIPSGGAWRTGARTAATPSSEQRITRQERTVHGVLAGAALAAHVR